MAESKPAAYGAPAAQALVASTTDRVRPNAKLIALLSLGHFVVDLNQGSLPAVLPFLKSATKRSEEHTSELQSPCNLVCRLLLEKKNTRAAVRYTATCVAPQDPKKAT